MITFSAALLEKQDIPLQGAEPPELLELQNDLIFEAAAPVKANEDRHAAESFELVLSKAKGAYEEIVAAADARAEEIIANANAEAASARINAQNQIADLTEKLAALRKQTADYYASLKRVVDAQSASMDQIKKLL